MKHFASDYEIEKAVARYEGLPFIPKLSAEDAWVEALRQFVRKHPDKVLPGTPKEQIPSEAYEAAVEHLMQWHPGFKQSILDQVENPANVQEIVEVLERAAGCYGVTASTYSSKKCNCWDGYERVPGTKPCAPGSCRKCDDHAKKESAKKKKEHSDKIDSQPFANPAPLADDPGYTAGGDSIEKALEKAPSAVGTGKEAGAHKVEKDGDKFYVTEKGEGNVAGPFNSQEDAYARANQLNDLENLEKEAFVREAGIMEIVNQIVGIYQQNPQFYNAALKAVASFVQSALKNNPDNSAGSAMFQEIKSRLKWAYDAWLSGSLNLDDLDEVIFGKNIVGDPWSQDSKTAAQGDKPSPHAAKAVFDALCEGNENTAIELLGHTDCPEGCETHAEGKCNHQYMSAGRTRVRYLVGSQAFKNSDKDAKEIAPADPESV